MLAHERREAILERSRVEPRVEVAVMAAEFDVTPETIRRDLSVLQRHGLVYRVHGGAIAVEKVGFEPSTEDRRGRQADEKARMGKAATDLVPAFGTIAIDAGTSTLALATQMPRDRELTVVTDSLQVALQLANVDSMTLFVVGGRTRPRTLATVGPWAHRAFQEVRVDVAFMGTNGLTVEAGLTTPDQAEAEVKRAMVRSARRVVVLADHTKFGVEHFGRFARLAEVDTVVSDTELDDEAVAAIEQAGPEVIRA